MDKFLYKIAHWMLHFFPSLIHYYNDDLWQFKKNGIYQLEKIEKNKFSTVLVLSCKHYTEQQVSYPIESYSELYNVLSLEYPKDLGYQFYISAVNNGLREVTIFKYGDSIPNAFITVPESLLLLQPQQENTVLDIPHLNTFFVRSPKGLFATKKTPLINSIERLSIATGAYIEKTIEISKADFPSCLLSGFKALNSKQWLLILKRAQLSLSPKTLLNAFSIPFIIVIAYLLTTSGFLAFKKSNLESQLGENRKEVNTVLSQQQQLSAYELNYQHLAEFFPAHTVVSNLWYVMPEAFENAQITRIQYQQGRVIIRGTTKKATDLLTLISKNAWVNEAKFDRPVSQSRQQERFVISFQLLANQNLANKQIHKAEK